MIARAPRKWAAPKAVVENAAHKTRLYYAGNRVAAKLLERGARKSILGPAIVSEYSATTFVPPGWKAAEDRHGNLLLSKIARKK